MHNILFQYVKTDDTYELFPERLHLNVGSCDENSNRFTIFRPAVGHIWGSIVVLLIIAILHFLLTDRTMLRRMDFTEFCRFHPDLTIQNMDLPFPPTRSVAFLIKQ